MERVHVHVASTEDSSARGGLRNRPPRNGQEGQGGLLKLVQIACCCTKVEKTNRCRPISLLPQTQVDTIILADIEARIAVCESHRILFFFSARDLASNSSQLCPAACVSFAAVRPAPSSSGSSSGSSRLSDQTAVLVSVSRRSPFYKDGPSSRSSSSPSPPSLRISTYPPTDLKVSIPFLSKASSLQKPVSHHAQDVSHPYLSY